LHGARTPAAERVNRMLSGFRFVIGAILATAMLGVGSFGLYATVKLRHQAKAGPIESSRNLVFDDRADWNQFYYPDSARLFEELVRKASASESAETSALPAARGAENVARQAAAQSAANDGSKERAADRSAGEPQRVTPAVETEPRVSSAPVWDEEPLLIGDEPPIATEHTGSTR
jgi:hypothetical protein